jgi:hypothetical protein
MLPLRSYLVPLNGWNFGVTASFFRMLSLTGFFAHREWQSLAGDAFDDTEVQLNRFVTA